MSLESPDPASRASGPLLAELSLFRFVSAEAHRRGLPLRTLGRVDDRLDPAQPGTFDASVRAMQYWCRLNEHLVLERHALGARLFVGFERASRVKPVAARYQKLAERVRALTLFAELDAPLPFDARSVDVAGSPLAREWFFAVDAPEYSALIVARDQHGFGPTGPLSGRRFSGLSTHNTQLVRDAIRVLERCAGSPLSAARA